MNEHLCISSVYHLVLYTFRTGTEGSSPIDASPYVHIPEGYVGTTPQYIFTTGNTLRISRIA